MFGGGVTVTILVEDIFKTSFGLLLWTEPPSYREMSPVAIDRIAFNIEVLSTAARSASGEMRAGGICVPAHNHSFFFFFFFFLFLVS